MKDETIEKLKQDIEDLCVIFYVETDMIVEIYTDERGEYRGREESRRRNEGDWYIAPLTQLDYQIYVETRLSDYEGSAKDGESSSVTHIPEGKHAIGAPPRIIQAQMGSHKKGS